MTQPDRSRLPIRRQPFRGMANRTLDGSQPDCAMASSTATLTWSGTRMNRSIRAEVNFDSCRPPSLGKMARQRMAVKRHRSRRTSTRD
jgi:hypothetical protein